LCPDVRPLHFGHKVDFFDGYLEVPEPAQGGLRWEKKRIQLLPHVVVVIDITATVIDITVVVIDLTVVQYYAH